MNRKFILTMAVVLTAELMLLIGWHFFITGGDDKAPKHHVTDEVTERVAPPTPTEEIAIVFIDGLPTAVMTATQAPATATATPSPTYTVTPTPTPEPKFTNTPTPKPPTPTKKAAGYTPGKAGVYTVPQGGHEWKPYARYQAITAKDSPQYRLQQMAKTDENGLRYVTDSDGTKRYCVALPVYWAGGTSKDIGRCFDVKMANGSTIHCVLGDIKKVEHSQNGEGKFGAHGELMEFQVDMDRLPDPVRNSGNISRFGGAFGGEAEQITVYDTFISGFGN